MIDKWLFSRGRFTTVLMGLLLAGNTLLYWSYKSIHAGEGLEKLLSLASALAALGMIHRLVKPEDNKAYWLATGIWAGTFVNLVFDPRISLSFKFRNGCFFLAFFLWSLNTWAYEEHKKRKASAR